MKLRNLFITLGLSLTIGAGALVGALNGSNKSIKEADAQIWRQNPTLYFVASNNWAKDNATFKMNYYDNTTFKGAVVATDTKKTYDSRKIYSFTVTDGTHVSAVQFLRFNSAGSQQWNYSNTFDISDSYDSGVNSLVMTSSCSTWDAWTSSTSGISWNNLSSITTTWTVTKRAVEFVNGVAQSPADWGLKSDTVIDGYSYPVPVGVNKNLEHFVGWYTNVACTTPYTARTISSNLTIYAKYNRVALDSYFYYVTEAHDYFDSVYFFGEYFPTAFPGDPLSTYATEVTNNKLLKFNGVNQLIYKIPCPNPSNANFSAILAKDNGSGGATIQTKDITNIVAGAGYYFWKEGSETKYSYSANADSGAAIDLLVRAETLRNATRAASGAPADYSICGISSSDAASLYLEYEGLSSSAKTMFDNSKTYTYDGADTSKQVDVSYASIMEEIYNLALKDTSFASTHDSRMFMGIFNNSDSSMAAIVTIVCCVALSTLAGYYFFKRSKKA